MPYLIEFVIALATALATTYWTRRLAIRFKIGELPDKRTMHQGFMPLSGGFGIYAGFLSGIITSAIFLPSAWPEISEKYWGILAASAVIVALGFYDDLKKLSAAKKFAGQFAAVTLIILSGGVIQTIQVPFASALPLGILAIPVTYLWLIGVSNAINLLDGLDGLAAGISLIVAGVFLVLAWQSGDVPLIIITVALIAGLIGFLRFNYYPASIFMGDTGSLFLGLILAALALPGFQSASGQISLFIPVVALAIPIGDTSVAFFRRLNKGRHPFKPDKDHLHHRLIYLGLSHKQAVHLIFAAAFIYGLTAYLIATQSAFFGSVLLFFVLLLSILGLNRMGYLEAQRIKTFFGDQQMIKVQQNIAPISMSRLLHKMLFGFTDIFVINLAFTVTWWVRFQSGLIPAARQVDLGEYFMTPATFLLTMGWLGLFVLTDLYNMRWDVSRFDQIKRTSKVILFGILLLFVITLDPNNILSEGRLTTVVYGLCLLALINGGRLIIIGIEKKLKILEYASQKTLLIGATDKARKLLKDIHRNPHLLYNVIGYVDKERSDKLFAGLPNLGEFHDLPHLIRKHGIEEVIIAINERSRDEILNIVAQAESLSIVFKIMPQIYDVVSGHKTEEVIGHPLIRLFPDRMHLWQWTMKRLIDLAIAGLLLALFLPFALIIIVWQMLSGIYPLFVIENVVGRNGDIFGMLNFQTQAPGKEKMPLIGLILYETRLNKFPSLTNIVLGKMSLVGPRPETVERVSFLQEKIKFYNRRFQVRPGFTGWAQVRYRYEEALKSYREQLKQDLFYLENMSISFDLRIMLRSMIIFLFKRKIA